MANIIAVIWDCDKTLIDGYMQDPIFAEYGVDPKQFWSEVNALPEFYKKTQGVKVNRDTIYLNHFIRYAKEGKFQGLNNAKLRAFGEKQKFYRGIPEILGATKKLLDDPAYTEYGIQVEHYIVSTGFAEVIRGSALMDYVEEVWGCELIEGPDGEGGTVISEVAYTIDNTTKTRAIFEINKGIPKLQDIDVNTRIEEKNRRVQLKNMIYIADGPSDIPAFSVVRQGGGATFAIYPRGDMAALQQVERMRADGRVDMFAEADYSQDSTARMWIENKIREIADRIRKEEREAVTGNLSEGPKHLG